LELFYVSIFLFVVWLGFVVSRHLILREVSAYYLVA
jgi:hypothetical protein